MCRRVVTDTQTGMLPGIPGSAICVQGFDDSLNSAIHTTYRISLRPSSLRLPRHPWFAIVKVVFFSAEPENIGKYLRLAWLQNEWLFIWLKKEDASQRRGGTRQHRKATSGRQAGLNNPPLPIN